MKFLNFKEVRSITGLSRTTIWRYENAGIFPHRVELGPRRVAWSEDKVKEWAESRPMIGGDSK